MPQDPSTPTLETPEDFAARLKRVNEMLAAGGIGRQPSVGGPERLAFERSRAQQPPPEKPSLTFGQRARLSFTSGQNQLWRTLVQDYGAANVLDLPDGRLVFRTGPNEPFQTVDESELTLNDMADLIGEIPEVAGQFAAVGPGKIPTQMAKAGAGVSIGRGVKQLIGKGLGVAGPETPGKVLTEMGVAGSAGAVGEGVGQVAVRTVTRFVSPFFKKAPFSKSVTEEGAETIRFYQGLRERIPIGEQVIEKRVIPFIGPKINVLKPLPSEVMEGTLVRMAQNISSKSILGGNVLEAFEAGRGRLVLKEITDEYAERLAAVIDLDKLGESFVDAIGSGFALAERAPIEVRRLILQRASERRLTANVSAMKEFAKKRETSKLAIAEFGDDIIAVIKSLKGTPEGVILLPDGTPAIPATADVPLAGLIELRKRLISLQKSFAQSANKNPALFVVNRLKGMADDAIKESLENGAPDLFTAWTEHNAAFVANRELYKNSYLKAILRRVDPLVAPQGSPAEPSKIAESVFQKGGIRRLKAVREALNSAQEGISREVARAGKPPVDDEVWKRLEDFLIQDLFKESVDQEGTIIGAKLLNQLQGPRSKYGATVLKEGLGLQVYNRLRMMGGILFRQQQGTSRGGIGTMFIQLAQPGAARGLVQGRVGNFVAIIGAPGVFSRFITSDFGFKLLTRSLKVPSRSPEVAALLVNMNSVSQELEQFIIDFYSGKLEDRVIEE